MCGILGVASALPLINCTWIKDGRDTMFHRGPDAAGEWWSENKNIVLTHRRLSILDLSPAGHQPMQDNQKGLVTIFNGEIYNFSELKEQLELAGYKFSSSSDTEILLASYDYWGADCLSHLNGMFAFAIYDARRKTIFIARDRAGEKPLFYHQENGILHFASELKALLANPKLPRAIEPQSLDCYLAMGFIPNERCILKGYKKLPAAHALTFNTQNGAINIWQYWQVPEFMSQAPSLQVDEAELLDELEVLLEDAVHKQLVADVPVGVLLSGGVDSSLVTAMAVRASSKVKTFTIGFPGHGELDETKHARLIAHHFGTEHTELIADPATAETLPKLACQFDEPMADSSMIPTFLVSQLVRQHCTVALGGDGGDELFGGYDHYRRLLSVQNRIGAIPLPIRQAISFSAEKLFPVGLKGRNWLQGLNADLVHGLPHNASFFDATTRRKLMSGVSNWSIIAEEMFQGLSPKHSDLLQRATRMDFHNYLTEDILVKVDRASMLNSLEMRAPMLDYRLIEFAFKKVPSYLKATSTDKKILLKRLTSKILPSEFDQQRKQGFSIPLAEWLKTGPFKKLFYEVLLDESSVFHRPTVEKLLQGQEKGRSNRERLFALVLFELWRKEYSISM